jgi:hypothetical protein
MDETHAAQRFSRRAFFSFFDERQRRDRCSASLQASVREPNSRSLG